MSITVVCLINVAVGLVSLAILVSLLRKAHRLDISDPPQAATGKDHVAPQTRSTGVIYLSEQHEEEIAEIMRGRT